MYHLPMKPAVGGKPPSDSRKTVISAASAQTRMPQTGAVVAQVVVGALALAQQRDDAERAEIRHSVRPPK